MSDINGLEITDVLGLSDPLSKLLETVSGGIGKVYEPIHIKRMAKAKAEELKLISAAVSDNITLPTIYENGKITVDSTNFEELMKRTQERFLFQELSKQSNIDAVVTKAYTELEKEESVSDIPVDKDWTSRFFDSVANVSNEEMQDIWAKILAGEVKQPGSFSLRMLDVIKNISKYEAEAFQKASPLLIGGEKEIFIVAEDKIYEKYSLNFSDILLLDECGLIISNGTLSYNMTVTPERGNHIICNDYVIMITNTSAEDLKVSCSVYTLTNVGKQLFNVLSPSVNREYVLDVAEYLWNKHKEKLIISVHALSHFEADGFIYNTIPIKEYKKENA